MIPIPNFPDYFITESGEVWSHKRTTPVRMKPFDVEGRSTVLIWSSDGRRYSKLIHRLVLEAFIGPCPEGMEACHNDGNKRNNHISNLRWDTKSANQLDRRRHGTASIGSAHGRAKFSEQEILTIRMLYSTGEFSYEQIGEMYGVNHARIGSIVRRETWKHVREEEEEE